MLFLLFVIISTKYSLYCVLLELVHKYQYTMADRRGARAVEGARLESVCAFTRTEGSNPSLSANYKFYQECIDARVIK